MDTTFDGSRADDLCAREPIHRPGSVQPHGALIALDPHRGMVAVAASHNLGCFLPPALAGNGGLGYSADALLGPQYAATLRRRLDEGRLRGEAPWQATHLVAGRKLDVAAHTHAGLVIVEMEEPGAHDEAAALAAARQLQETIADLRATTGELPVLARVVASGMRALTGYERVIVYRFDADWNGQAIAEDKVDDWHQSLDGLHFPAADIPAQARALYERNTIRWVLDRDAIPVAIEPVSAGEFGGVPTGGIDLSFARLRTLSPVHLQYHRNMGVNGSMSLSILHGGRLWGLVVCHHRSPHAPGAGQRAAAAALTDAFALRVSPAEHAGAEQARRRDRDILARLLARIADAEEVVPALVGGGVTLASLFEATGAALFYEGSVTLLGRTPPREAVERLRAWLAGQDAAIGHLFSSDSLSRLWPEWQPHEAVASGVLAVFLDAHRSDLLLWFRQEEPQAVSWGGDPRKEVTGDTVLPRQSFERWVEMRHGIALPWRPWQLELAEQLRHAITEVIVRSLRHIAELNERLRQSQKMEAVGQLTGGLAHDFNNLLTGIGGSLELLGTRVGQGRYKDLDRYIVTAQGATKRAAALTHRLLAFSRRQTLDPKPTDVNRLVGGLEDLIRRTVGPAVQIEVVGAAGLWPTMVDPNQLENALLNLCINARDAMPGGGRLTIETANRWIDQRAGRERDLQPGQYVSLSVSDTGTGMPPDVIAKAFDPFFTTKPLGQGTGLGLSMTYGFVRQSGGQARIYSEPGHGAMVCLYLPRHMSSADTSGGVPDLADAPRAGQGETVLIVDDEPTVRILVSEVLEELGYTAIEAADGVSGLRVLQSDVRVDLVITDVGLPGGMNGRQMADAARVSRPTLKVLFITGYAENAVIGNGQLEPGMHVITKPFAMEALANRVKELIAH